MSQNQTGAAKTDTLAQPPKHDGLEGRLTVREPATIGTPVVLTFTVKNPTDSVQRFCKWHTPFEPFISKYLDITDSEGNEVPYTGAMAKRVMPPPADAYISIPVGDSVSTTVDLDKGYALKKVSMYHIKYNGQDMSGIKTVNEVSFQLGQ